MVTAVSIIGTIALAISGGIYTYTNYKIASIWVLFVALTIYAFAFCWFLQNQVLRTVKLKEPTFSENVDSITFSLGERGISVGYKKDALIKSPKKPYTLGGYSPVLLYIKNDNLYADVKIYGGSGLPPIEIKRNKLLNKPNNWDFNSNNYALEIVTENKVPIYQFFYKTSSHIVVNGIFPFPGGLILANEEGADMNPKLPTTFKLKRIFKYPS